MFTSVKIVLSPSSVLSTECSLTSHISPSHPPSHRLYVSWGVLRIAVRQRGAFVVGDWLQLGTRRLASALAAIAAAFGCGRGAVRARMHAADTGRAICCCV